MIEPDGNPFRSIELASSYEGWYHGPGRRASRLEKRLLGSLLGGFDSPRSALEIGCGTGHFSRWLGGRGLTVTGVDTSLPMLAESVGHGASRVVVGDGGLLPFDDLSFDLVLMVTVLEFARDIEAVSYTHLTLPTN